MSSCIRLKLSLTKAAVAAGGDGLAATGAMDFSETADAPGGCNRHVANITKPRLNQASFAAAVASAELAGLRTPITMMTVAPSRTDNLMSIWLVVRPVGEISRGGNIPASPQVPSYIE